MAKNAQIRAAHNSDAVFDSIMSQLEPELQLTPAEVAHPLLRVKKSGEKCTLEECMAEAEYGQKLKVSRIPDYLPPPPEPSAAEEERAVWGIQRVLTAIKEEVKEGRCHKVTASRIYGRLMFMARYEFLMPFLDTPNLAALGSSQAILRAVADVVDEPSLWVGPRRAAAEGEKV